MRIGILGAGHMGRMLARLFLAAGHEVALANSRGPASLAPLLAELGERARGATPRALARHCEVIVLATRWEQTPLAVQDLGPLDGEVVIDTTNNRFGPGPEDLYDVGDRTSSEVVAGLVPGARLVKAFNHQPIPALDELRGAGGAERRALFVAGDDAGAKQVVARLVRDIGGEPMDTGSLREGGRLQGTGGPLAGFGRLLGVAEAREVLGRLAGRTPPHPPGT